MTTLDPETDVKFNIIIKFFLLLLIFFIKRVEALLNTFFDLGNFEVTVRFRARLRVGVKFSVWL